MSRYIVRRDPTRPAFWYMSFNAPHPPMVPLEGYLDMYRDIEIDMPFFGDWAKNREEMPYALQLRRSPGGTQSEVEVRMARKAFYALSTHADHQIRTVIGTLQEEGLVDNTIVLFTSDHGDLLGNHGFWSKTVFYEDSAKVPMVLVPTAAQGSELGYDVRDDRLAAQCDVMPTLLELCGIPVPDTVEGLSLVGDKKREYLYGEFYEDVKASRMVRDARHKLVYYPTGNRFQLFDMLADPDELNDLADEPGNAEVRHRLTEALIPRLHGRDLEWLEDGRLVGTPLPDGPTDPGPNRDLSNQRGMRFR